MDRAPRVRSAVVVAVGIAFGVSVLCLSTQRGRRPRPTELGHEREKAEVSERRLEVLLATYAVERQDNSSMVSMIAAIVGFILAYLVGAMALLLSSLRTSVGPWIILAVPSIPTILFAWISLFVVEANARRSYLLELERQIRDEHASREDSSRKIPSWMEINARVFVPGYRPSSRLFVSAATAIVYGGGMALLVILASYTLAALPNGYTVWMLIIYVPAILIIAATFLASNLWAARLLK